MKKVEKVKVEKKPLHFNFHCEKQLDMIMKQLYPESSSKYPNFGKV